MDMDRIVFATDIQKKPPKWSTWGALEVAVKQNKWSGGSDGHVVLYRAQDGTIEDISYESDIEILGYAHRETVHITKPFDADAEGALQIGFDINIEQLPDWDSSVNNVENAGFDNGTFTFMDGNEVRTVAWRGTFIAMSDSSLDTVKAGSQPLPSWIEDFLAITPLEDDDDKVNEWTSSLVEELCLHALPDKAKRLFYHNDIPKLGSKFRKGDYSEVPLPIVVGKGGPRWLRLQNILDDNERLFELASMHFLCRDLSRADWLENEYRSQLPDKVDQFFKLVGAPPNTSSTDLQTYKNSYGNGLTAVQECESLRKMYANAIKRCYYFAYICFDDRWPSIIHSAHDESFDEIEEVLLSDNYKEHWLPTLIGIPDEAGTMPFKEQMAMLTEKLALLTYHLQEHEGLSSMQSEVDDIVKNLTEAAQRTGLLRDNLIDFKHKDITLNPQAIFNEQTRREVERFKAAERAAAASRDLMFIDVDVESRVTHAFLRDEAKPLGLYTWESALKFW